MFPYLNQSESYRLMNVLQISVPNLKVSPFAA